MAKIHSRKRFFLRKKHSESQQPSPGKQHAVGNQTEMSHQSASRTWEVVVRVRPTLLVAIVGAAILMLPSQVLELYIIDAEAIRLAVFKPPSFENLLSFSEVWTQLSTVATQLRSLFMFGLAGIVAAIVLWLSTIHLLSLPEAIDGQPPRQRRLGLFLAVVIGLSPFLGALAGLNAVRAAIPAIGEANAQVIGGWPSGLSVVPDDYLRATLGFLLVSAILIALILGTFLTTLTTRHLHGLQITARGLYSPLGIVIGLGLIALVVASITNSPTTLSWKIGSEAMLNLFIASLAFVFTWFSSLYRRTGIPVTVIVLTGALSFSALGWSDNHQIDYTVGSTERREFAPSAHAWLTSRSDREFYQKLMKPYPVYVVAAEGGGMYAGYHAATWLSAMQDRCPNFAQHTFAISSVSGGSVGAAVFATWARRLAENTEHRYCDFGYRLFRGGAETFFSYDMLSPLVAAALFPDTLQRIIPYPFKALDRARALEAAFAVAWDGSYVLDEPKRGDSAGGTISPQNWPGHFDDLLSKTWAPGGAAPALFLNTTDVQTGSRVTVGPIRFDQTATAEHIADALCAGHHSIDLPLKTAVSLSARFPWLTPAGWFEIRDGSAPCGTRTGRGRLYLADGGYFENSGLETAIEIASLLRSLQAEYPDLKTEFPFGIEVKIIMIFSSDGPVWAPPDVESANAGELSAPIQTLLATRTARTRAVHLQAILEHRDLPAFKDRDQVRRYPIRGSKIIRTGIDDIHQVALDRSKFNLPLGWVLSTRSLEEIQKNDDKSAQLAFDLVEAELSGESTDDVKRAGSAE